jgi:hypothetical protein
MFNVRQELKFCTSNFTNVGPTPNVVQQMDIKLIFNPHCAQPYLNEQTECLHICCVLHLILPIFYFYSSALHSKYICCPSLSQKHRKIKRNFITDTRTRLTQCHF